jgi:hypothetical protein
MNERARLLRLINASWTTQAISVATLLGLPELLREAPQTAHALARETGCHEPSLTRLLRALTSIDLVAASPEGTFALTPTGGLLSPHVAGSLAAWAEFCGTRSWATWGSLLESVRTGHSRRRAATGADGFHHLEDDAQNARLFNRAMVDLTRPVATDVARRLDWSGVDLVVDVGGGYGELLAAILRANPSMRGILLDLAHATDGVEGCLADEVREGRCSLVTGSFFDSVPGQADAYLLKSVLHDWDDDAATAILHTCRRAMAPHAKLLVIERVAPEQFGRSPRDQGIARSDLNMLVSTGGRERTGKEYRELLAAAGLRIARFLPVGDPYHVIEAAAR